MEQNTQIILGKYTHTCRSFCGSTAIQLLTDIDYKRIRALVNIERDRPMNRAVMGISQNELISVLKVLGLNVYLHEHFRTTKRRETLKQYVESLPESFIGIVWVANHYVAVHRKEVADTFVHWFVPVELHPYALSRVRVSYQLN